MQPTSTVRLKVCCIASLAEAAMAVAAGASAIGLVSAMPSGPGVIADALIAEIAAKCSPGVASFLLTCRQDAAALIAQARLAGVSTVQICDRVNADVHRQIRAALPNIKVVQVIHVADANSLDEALAASESVDALLLDSGNLGLAVKELGGTGRRHDWQISRRIREAVGVPVFLAGGLGAANVVEAIEMVRPFGLDVCTGVRTNGKLDAAKLDAMVAAIRSVR